MLPEDERTVEQRLRALKSEEFFVFLFIMASTKMRGHQQPSLFVKYIYYLNDKIGWTTPYGPLRRFLAEDFNPKSEREYQESEMWLIEHGLKERPDIHMDFAEGALAPMLEDAPVLLALTDVDRTISESSPPKQVSQPEEEERKEDSKTPIDIEVDYDPDETEKSAQPSASSSNIQTTPQSS